MLGLDQNHRWAEWGLCVKVPSKQELRVSVKDDGRSLTVSVSSAIPRSFFLDKLVPGL